MLLPSSLLGDDVRSSIVLRGAPAPNERLHTTTEGDVRVTTAVPSAKETKEIFGVKLYKRNIQPVWVKIENLGVGPLWFMPIGLDPGYFTPFLAAYRQRAGGASKSESVGRSFYDRGMALQIDPGHERTGYVFSRLDEGTKSFNIDVVSRDEDFSMTFFVPVPGLRLDHYDVDWEALYPPEQIVEHDTAGLVPALEELPCCTTDKKNKGTGDPLNIVVIGDLEDVYRGFIRAGWDETETIYGKSSLKTVKSFFSGGEYRYSPVSALYVFERGQDMALQKARENIHERNHLRLWLSPMRHEGKMVWIGQISRDIGVRFTKKTITTHKIDPDVDETREFLIEDLAYAQSLVRFGYVGGVGAAPIDEPRGNLTGDPYFTDGRRVVLWVSSQPVDIAEVEQVDLQGASD
jgi:hypothetical protein